MQSRNWSYFLRNELRSRNLTSMLAKYSSTVFNIQKYICQCIGLFLIVEYMLITIYIQAHICLTFYHHRGSSNITPEKIMTLHITHYCNIHNELPYTPPQQKNTQGHTSARPNSPPSRSERHILNKMPESWRLIVRWQPQWCLAASGSKHFFVLIWSL